MLALILALAQLPSPAPQGEIVRGNYGVPHIVSNTWDGAFFYAGYAAAEDRLYQIDLSRRSATGRLSELIGRPGVASDKEALRFAYTEAEYEKMFSVLSPKAQSALKSYTDGINAWMRDAAERKKLPKQYAGETPAPWQVSDSLAIGVNLVRRFGRFGAGEIRNLLLYAYLQDKLKDNAVRAIEDLAWQNDTASITTVADADDPFKGASPFPPPNKDALAKHLAMLPKVNMMELLPGIRIEEQEDMALLAEQLGIVHKWGSYAAVVSKEKSGLGVPLLMNGPQMGFSAPSIIHQMSIECPEYKAIGMDLPGVPGILVGHSPSAAWGITSGVADTDDVFFVKLNPRNPDQYEYRGEWREFEIQDFIFNIKGDVQGVGRREMSVYGPVVIKSISTNIAYVRKSPLWQAETDGLQYMLQLPSAKTMSDVQRIARNLNLSINLFAATSAGEIGWFFCGRVPIRNRNIDPRFPTPGDGEHDWTGILPPEKMPYAINPRQGFIANWNNKPVSWWPNFDTPVWGRVFQNEMLVDALKAKPKTTTADIRNLVRELGTSGYEHKYFLPELLATLRGRKLTESESRALDYLESWEGDYYQGSAAPAVFLAFFDALRQELFLPKLGNFLAPANFNLIIRASVTWSALHGKTQLDYLDGRKPSDVMAAAFAKGVAQLESRQGAPSAWGYPAPRITWNGLPEMLYSNRGTYIQIVELWKEPSGVFVAPPGVSEDPDSPHYSDQLPIASAWAYFPMEWAAAARKSPEPK